MGEMNSSNGNPDNLRNAVQGEIGNPAVLEHPTLEAPDKVAITHELQSILSSPFFRTSKRSQQFLSYVVQYTLDGNLEPLKERTIGTEVFNRPAGYATGDDSVVRVQAGEVRRRLEQYYQGSATESLVRIELPLGSYAPEFRWAQSAIPAAAPLASPEPDSVQPIANREGKSPQTSAKRKNRVWTSALVACLVLTAALAGYWVHRTRAPKSVLDQFWAPIFATSKPLLICLPKPVTYRPSVALFKRHEKTPGEFDHEVDRMNARPNLSPDEKLVWGDMIEYGDLGVGSGDVAAAIRLSTLLGRIGKDNEVRIGNTYSFEDLRNSPAIIIGAFSNRWTMQMTSNLHFAFAEENAVFRIQEQGSSGKRWYARLDSNGQIVEDYGVVTRLVNSSTGQFVVDIAGITSDGSEAAAEIATSPESLEKALQNAPSDWSRKNVQILVRTTVTDSIAGPAQVVAIYVW
ncbi:MAG: hypothetical protein ABR923_21185 [Terracidiphilus sp.]|jgi:hypothetical protein